MRKGNAQHKVTWLKKHPFLRGVYIYCVTVIAKALCSFMQIRRFYVDAIDLIILAISVAVGCFIAHIIIQIKEGNQRRKLRGEKGDRFECRLDKTQRFL